MQKPKDRSLEEQIKEAQLGKLRAEEEKARNEAAEIKKRLNQKKIFGIPVYQTIVGGIVAGVFIITFSWTFLTPVLNKDAEIAKRKAELLNIENKLERARLDSSNRELEAQKIELEKKVQMITARLDSTTKRKQDELRLVNNALKKEQAKSESDQKKINDLTMQVSTLQKDIKNTKNEKEQIKNIAASPYLTVDEAKLMIKSNKYYDRSFNPQGVGVENKFSIQPGESVVYDATTGLYWQKSGSEQRISYNDAKTYVAYLNNRNFGDSKNWCLPTLEEAMSLMEPAKKNGDLYIDPIFDRKQRWIWTADKGAASAVWVVIFFDGYCVSYDFSSYGSFYVRAVR